MQDAQVAEHDALTAAVPDLSVHRQCGLVVDAGLLHAALVCVQVAQVAEHHALIAAVPDLSVHSQCGLVVGEGLFHAAQ